MQLSPVFKKPLMIIPCVPTSFYQDLRLPKSRMLKALRIEVGARMLTFQGIDSAIPLPASIKERNEAQMSVARKLEIANIEVFKVGVGPKVDTISSLGYTPTVRGSLVFQVLKPKAAEVIEILDDVHQGIIKLLDNNDTNLSIV
jgi:hypothetical protein